MTLERGHLLLPTLAAGVKLVVHFGQMMQNFLLHRDIIIIMWTDSISDIKAKRI